MNNLFRLSFLAVLFASCQNSGNRKMTEPVPATPATFTTNPVVVPDSTKPVPVASPAVSPATTTNTNTTNTSPGVKLNPAHGAPGHNCDLPVGAPLNGPVGGTAAPATQASTPQVIMNTTPPPTQPASKNVRLNPAHGAPGHDCGIPVGQPLKS